jgi:hypothetical protein
LGDGRWRLRVFVGRDERGHIKQLSRNFKGTKREAETALARLVTDINRQKVATTAPQSAKRAVVVESPSSKLRPAA